MTVLERIKKKLGNEKVGNVREMILSDVEIRKLSGEIKTHLQKFINVEVVYLNRCELQELNPFPQWKLTAIDLSQNNLTDSCLEVLGKIPSLVQILLLQNNISKIESLKALAPLIQLEEIDFTNNPIAKEPTYRQQAFSIIPNLIDLDGKDKNGEVFEEEPEQYSSSQGSEDEDSYEADEDNLDDFEEEEEQSEKPKKKKK